MFDNILSTSLIALIAAVAVAAGVSAFSSTANSRTAKLEVVTFSTVVVTGKRETVVAGPQVVQFPTVMVTGRRVLGVADVSMALAD